MGKWNWVLNLISFSLHKIEHPLRDLGFLKFFLTVRLKVWWIFDLPEAKMIQLLFLVIFAEGVVVFLLLVKIGLLREFVIKNLDQLKMGKGPATVKTIAATMSVILLSSLMNIVKIQNKGAKLGTMSPMDQVLWRTQLLEASLIGMFNPLHWLLRFVCFACYFVL